MNNFKSALDKVKADEILIEKTKNYVRNNLQKEQEKNKKYARGNIIMKKYLVAATFAVVILGGSITGYAYYKTPTSYVSLDINPSVEIGVNAFDRVVSVTSANEDGDKILENSDVINNNVEDAVDELVQSAIDNNYVNEDGSTVISLIAESKDAEKAEELQNDSEEGAKKAINFKKYAASIYKDCSDLSLRTEAKSLGISPGKFKLIKMLQSLDPTITVDQYKDAKVSEIMAKARELIAAMPDDQIKDKKIKEIKEKMQDVAKRVKENKEKAIIRKQERKAEKEANASVKASQKESRKATTKAYTNKNGRPNNGIGNSIKSTTTPSGTTTAKETATTETTSGSIKTT